MENNLNISSSLIKEDEIDLKELFLAIINGKWIILLMISLFSVVGVLYSLSLPNIYQSTALLYSTEQQSSGIGGAMKGYSGLAGLAGINLSSQSSESNSVKALKKVNSLSFFADNLMPNIFLPDLMAVDSWNKETNFLRYNEDIYNETSKIWLRDFKYPQTQIPSAQESFEVFKEHILVTDDQDSGFVTISVKHKSPFIAQEWTKLVVDQLNNYFRNKDKVEAEIAVTYLKEEIAKTNFTEVKQVIAELLQGRTQQLSLIEVGEYYVFAYIDPPVVMEKKAEPIRSIICIMFAIVGTIIGMVLVIFRHFLTK
tara:strand:- start:2704 stop:3639 length:936 start_codon:yes stop_codon:yes gene_type:complete